MYGSRAELLNRSPALIHKWWTDVDAVYQQRAFISSSANDSSSLKKACFRLSDKKKHSAYCKPKSAQGFTTYLEQSHGESKQEILFEKESRVLANKHGEKKKEKKEGDGASSSSL